MYDMIVLNIGTGMRRVDEGRDRLTDDERKV